MMYSFPTLLPYSLDASEIAKLEDEFLQF